MDEFIPRPIYTVDPILNSYINLAILVSGFFFYIILKTKKEIEVKIWEGLIIIYAFGFLAFWVFYWIVSPLSRYLEYLKNYFLCVIIVFGFLIVIYFVFYYNKKHPKESMEEKFPKLSIIISQKLFHFLNKIK